MRATHEPKVGQLVLAVGRPGKSGPMASLGVIGLVGGKGGHGQRRSTSATSSRPTLPCFRGFPADHWSTRWGEILGLNSSTMGRGSGFTLPNEAIDQIVTSLQQHGKVRRGFLGVSAQAVAVNDQLAEALSLESNKALVIVGLESGGPAEQQGLLIGDIIVRVAGTPVGSVDQLMEQLSGDVVGQPVDDRCRPRRRAHHQDRSSPASAPSRRPGRPTVIPSRVEGPLVPGTHFPVEQSFAPEDKIMTATLPSIQHRLGSHAASMPSSMRSMSAPGPRLCRSTEATATEQAPFGGPTD